jgi:YbbR domain-containing protein
MWRLARLAEHWRLKLLAVIFAVGLWLFAASQDRTEAVYTVPLELTDRTPGLDVTSLGIETVVVRVQGARRALERLRDEDLRVEVSLRGLTAGRFAVRIPPSSVTVPRGIKVLRVTPSQVRGTLEAR